MSPVRKTVRQENFDYKLAEAVEGISGERRLYDANNDYLPRVDLNAAVAADAVLH